MATLDGRSTTVLAVVTSLGRRGWRGGGHTGRLARRTNSAEMRAAKNIDSAPMKKTMATRRLSSGRRGDGSGPSSPPPVGGRGGPIRPLAGRMTGGRGDSRSLVATVTTGFRRGWSRPPAPPSPRAGRARSSDFAPICRDATDRRGADWPRRSPAVKRQEREQDGQIEDRCEHHAAHSLAGGGEGVHGPQGQEGHAEEQRA